MAKYKERLNARELRIRGKSIGQIASLVGVSKSSVSLWCRDIILTKQQLNTIMQKEDLGRVEGRMKAWEWHRKEKRERMGKHHIKGKGRIGEITDRELLLVGLSLYWAEGSKRDGVVSLVNSDPIMIMVFIEWLTRCFYVRNIDLTCKVGINESHKNRLEVVEKYWSDAVGIPRDQFRLASLKKVNNMKVYANRDNHYGSLVVRVKKSTNMFYEILGCIAGLKQSVEVKYRL